MVRPSPSVSPMVQLETMAGEEGGDPHKSLPKGLPTTLELSGGILILARVKPSEETDFAQILLPVALSHETFLCKLCVALGVEKNRGDSNPGIEEDVRKIVKLPDILIKTTDDVLRLVNWDKLEVRLKRKSPLRTVAHKLSDVSRSVTPALGLSALLLYLGVVLVGQMGMQSELGSLAANLSATRDAISHLLILSNVSLPPSPALAALTSRPDSLASAIDDLAARIREPIQSKLEYLERGIISLAQRVKETKALLTEIKNCPARK